MRKLLSFIFSGELSLVLFLFSGYFKMYIPFTMFDIAIIFGLNVVFQSIRSAMKNKSISIRKMIGFTLLFAFGTYLMISMTYSESVFYAQDKTFKYFFVTLFSATASMILLENMNRIKRFIYSLITVGSLMALGSIFWQEKSQTGLIYLENYSNIGKASGISLLCSLLILLFDNISRKARFVVFLCSIASLVGVIISGARMPILAAAFLLIIYTFSLFRFGKGGKITYNKKLKFFLLLFVTTGVFLSVNFKNSFIQSTMHRMAKLFAMSSNNDTTGRLERFNTAFNLWSENVFLGKGIGSYALESAGTDIRSYPHNVFLETLAELGIVGFILLFAILLFAGVSIINGYKMASSKNKFLIQIILLISIYSFLIANVAGDLNDNRILFALLATCIAVPKAIMNEKIKNNAVTTTQ